MSAASPPGPGAAREVDRRASRQERIPTHSPPKNAEVGGHTRSHRTKPCPRLQVPLSPRSPLSTRSGRPVRISGPAGPVRHLLSTHQACPECEHHAGRPPRSNGHLAQAPDRQTQLNAKFQRPLRSQSTLTGRPLRKPLRASHPIRIVPAAASSPSCAITSSFALATVRPAAPAAPCATSRRSRASVASPTPSRCLFRLRSQGGITP